MNWEILIRDGVKAVQRLRHIEAQQGSARNVIVGVTVHARTEQIAKTMEAGMDTKLPKPLRVVELPSMINNLCNSRRMVEDMTERYTAPNGEQ
jgi:DNA-binding NarL/FixJ family response regulator